MDTQKPPVTKADRKKRRKTCQDAMQCNVAPEKENALMIRVVLQIIFGCLNAKDLRSCRLVNTSWNTEAIFHLKRRSDYINFGLDPSTEKIYEFLDCVKSSRDFPFNKLYISYGMETVARNELLTSFGSRLTSLKIDVALKTGSFPRQLDFPKLSELNFSEHYYDRNGFNFIPYVLKKYSGQLTSIKVNEPWTGTLKLLANLPALQLNQLKIVYYEMNQSEMVLKVLVKHKETLMHLKLSSHKDNSWLKSVQLPQLQFLKIKSIDNFHMYEGVGIPFPSLNSFSYVSCVSETNTDQKLAMLFGEQPAPTVKSVQLSESSITTETVSHLFPNVEQLQISAMQANLLQIMEPLTKLTELEIDLTTDTNANLMNLLTGLTYKWGSKKSLERMEEEVGSKLEQSPYSVLHRIERIKLSFYEIHKNLSTQNLLLPCRLLFPQMKNLRQLTIHHTKKKNFILSKRIQSVLGMLQRKVVVKYETPINCWF